MNNIIKEAMALLEFPEEAVVSLLRDWDEIKDGNIGKIILEGREKYIADDSFNPKSYLGPISDACKAENRSKFPAHALYLLTLAAPLKERYKKLGILDDNIYVESMKDLKWKMIKTFNNEDIWGTLFGDWNAKFFVPDIFTLGRLEFEIIEFGMDYSAHGFTLTPDSTVINMHIPASGPMPPELCMDSFKRAHEFFREHFPSGISVFMVESWMIFPRHREFLPETSNILKFMDFFELVKSNESEPGERWEMWRIFGRHGGDPADKLPRDTGLRRAYADWLQNGGTVGDGHGVFFFDGEKIIR